MSLLLLIWESLQSVTLAVFYISIVILLILLEKHFIRKRSRGELILPVIALAAAVILSVTTFHESHGASSGLQHWQVLSQNTETGRVIAVCDKERDLKALGQYVRRDNEAAAFIDLEVKKGKVVSASQPLSKEEKQSIEETLSYHRGRDFSGSSQTYEELIPDGEKYEFYEVKLTYASFLAGMVWYGIPAAVLLVMYLSSKLRRILKNGVKKTKLQDL